MKQNAPPVRDRVLAIGSAGLGVAIGCYVLLGPLILDVIRLRTSPAALSQVEGGDIVALVVVAPLCLTAAILAWRGSAAAPIVALAPALYAAYTYSQVFLGSEYFRWPGNVERFFPLFMGIVVLAVVVGARAWTSMPGTIGERIPAARLLGLGWVLLVTAFFVVFGIHARSYVDAVGSHPQSAAYLDAPTAFWVVKFWDLAIVVPAAVVVGVGLLRRRPWAARTALGLLGGFVTLGMAVTAMAVRMYVVDDPDASIAMVTGAAAVTAAGLVFAQRVYAPALRATRLGSPRPR